MLLNRNDKIGPYTVIAPIKEGAVAASYRVRDPEGTKRFLKLIKGGALDHTQTDENGALLETGIARVLDHHNLCRYVDSGEIVHAGQKFFYIVQEFIPGETLEEAISRGRTFSIYDVKKIMRAILSALGFLHSLPRPVVHDGLSIGNILLNFKTDNLEDVKLVGFSHARYLDMPYINPDPDTQNVFYLAPERMAGICSAHTDLYSAAITLYKLIYNCLPWFCDLSHCRGEDKFNFVARARKRPLRVPEVEKYELDTQLVNTVKKGLLPNADSRFQTAGDFIDALDGTTSVEDPEPMMKAQYGSEKKWTVARHEPAKGEGFAAIAGMQQLKDLVREEVIDAITHQEEYRRYGVTIPNGMLLYGPPGCGKTFFAKKLAEEVGFTFMAKKPSDLQSKYVNGTQENIAAMFQEAEDLAPSIIFIDEMNELAPNRSEGTHHEMYLSAVNELLANMDRLGEKGIFLIGATNYPDLMDPAILRSGRIDKLFYVAPPDFEARKAMFRLMLKGRPVDNGLDYDRLGHLTENYVFSDLALIINEASRAAMRAKTTIGMDVLTSTISATRPSITADDIRSFEAVRRRIEGDKSKPRRPIGFH